MPKISLDGFRDPASRPRFILWTGTILIAAIALVIVAFGISSSTWFCSNGCHQVQDDTIAAWQRSSHAEVSCLACHMPVNADPATFTYHKAQVGIGGIWGVLTGFELPINPESEIAMDTKVMPEGQCTQCHSANRIVTPSDGIVINHKIHSAKGVTCTMCHNRVGHDERGLRLVLEGNKKHEDFMKMEGCFRCHDLGGKKKAGGDCRLCHPAGFQLKPENHFEAGFYKQYGDSSGHAKLAKADSRDSYCSMCHVKDRFCTGCHGIAMPHPADFQKSHGTAGKQTPKVCANCHAKGKDTAKGTEFCNACHHKQGDPSKPWIPQHFKIVRESDPNACFDCHNPAFCADCHVKGLGGR